MTGVALAAPITDLDNGETVAGYLEWQLGASQEIGKNLSLNVNYRYYDEDDIILKALAQD